MQDHVKSLEALLAYLGGELSAAESSNIEQHVQGCNACQQAVARAQRVQAACRSLNDVALPAGLTERVLASVPSPRRRGWVYPALAALAAACLLVLLWRGLRPAPAAALVLGDGRIEIVSTQGVQVAEQVVSLLPHTQVRTGAQSHAILVMADDASIRLGEQTATEIRAPRDISVQQGRVWVVGSSLEVETPQAGIELLSAVADVRVETDGTSVTVHSGSARIGTLRVPAGFTWTRAGLKPAVSDSWTTWNQSLRLPAALPEHGPLLQPVVPPPAPQPALVPPVPTLSPRRVAPPPLQTPPPSPTPVSPVVSPTAASPVTPPTSAPPPPVGTATTPPAPPRPTITLAPPSPPTAPPPPINAAPSNAPPSHPNPAGPGEAPASPPTAPSAPANPPHGPQPVPAAPPTPSGPGGPSAPPSSSGPTAPSGPSAPSGPNGPTQEPPPAAPPGGPGTGPGGGPGPRPGGHR